MAPLEIRHRSVRPISAKHAQASRFLQQSQFAGFTTFEDEQQLTDFVSRLEAALSQPIDLDAVTIFPGASLGVAIFPTDGTTREQIVNNADLAMYRAKDTVGRQTCYYEQSMDDIARARRMIANDLREAIGRGELSLAYQVQKDVATEEVSGYEALLRWHHPRDGWISPARRLTGCERSDNQDENRLLGCR
ncbi:MAG: EAL domain-containing protein [Rhizorhabdus sp.]|uniref:EAL domain-containing protein n=1 Tax=Rhizorhabdus sp. TaxID=1968843 RepID=UPI001B59D8A3|nr:EAL domain-containing protein [Rhizorhabdus sp.]MBP8232408.1 EAL domain-containing protein [Rhizorhabdus sp.]